MCITYRSPVVTQPSFSSLHSTASTLLDSLLVLGTSFSTANSNPQCSRLSQSCHMKLSTQTGKTEAIEGMMFLFVSIWLFVTAKTQILLQEETESRKVEKHQKSDGNVSEFKTLENCGCSNNAPLWPMQRTSSFDIASVQLKPWTDTWCYPQHLPNGKPSWV